jgi:hypothetical protein
MVARQRLDKDIVSESLDKQVIAATEDSTAVE